MEERPGAPQRTFVPRAGAWLLLLAAIVVPRILDLGTILTVDEPLWQGRAHRFIIGIATVEPRLTFVGGQPGITTVWLAGLADRFGSLAASQAAIALGVSLLTVLSVILLNRLVGPPIAFLGGLFMALDPFFIAHSRVVHTDALLATFTILSLLLLALAWKTHRARYLVAAAVTTALSLLTKVFGAIVLVAAAAVTILGPFPLSRARRILLFLGVLVLTVVVVWPAAWSPVGPLAYIGERLEIHGTQMDIGRGGEAPLFYLSAWLVRTTPVSLIAGSIGILGALIGTGRVFPRFPARRLFLSLAGFALLDGILLSLGGQKADRYFLLGFLVTDLLAAAGIVWASTLVHRRFPRIPPSTALIVLSLTAVVLTLSDTVRLHPYTLVQANHLFPRIQDTLRLGWGEGLDLVGAWLNREGQARPLTSVSYYSRVLAHFADGHVDRLGHEYDRDTDTVVLYRAMFGRDPAGQETQYLHAYFSRGRCLYRVELNGLPYAWVFARLPENSGPSERDVARRADDLPLPPTCESTQRAAPPLFSLGRR